MTPAELADYLDGLIRHDIKLSTMIWGPPGIGKSSIVAQRAEAHQLSFIDLRLSQLAPTDLRGLPVAENGVSRWYPPEHQGTALGIAGAGNSGTVLAALFAPSLATFFGWQAVFGLVAIPLILTLAAYLFLAKDSPATPPPKPLLDYFKVLRIGDAWCFMFFYGVTFGGFVGLASSLTIYFNDQYGLGPIVAGYFTAACVFAGSMVRPVGGAIADRVGGVRSLSVMYVVAAAAIGVVSVGLPQAWMSLAVFVIGMLALGMGNGAVFQLVPQRFRRPMGLHATAQIE